MNPAMYYLTHAKQRMRLAIPSYRLGRSVRFKLSELAEWATRAGWHRAGADRSPERDEIRSTLLARLESVLASRLPVNGPRA